mgnify:FL=1
MVYDITDRESFVAVKHWLQEIEKYRPRNLEMLLEKLKLFWLEISWTSLLNAKLLTTRVTTLVRVIG